LENLLLKDAVNKILIYKQVSVQLFTSAVNVALPAFAAARWPCNNQSLSHIRRARSSKPAARLQQLNGTDTVPL